MEYSLRYSCKKTTPRAVQLFLKRVVDYLNSSGVACGVDVGTLTLLEDSLATNYRATKQVEEDGMMIKNRFGELKIHPLMQVRERSLSQSTALLRELGLTVRSRKDLPDLQDATKEESEVEKYFKGLQG